MTACSACGAPNSENNKFCGACGKPVRQGELRCSACDSLLTLEDRFCPNCATPVARTSGASPDKPVKVKEKNVVPVATADADRKQAVRKGPAKLSGMVLSNNPLRIMPEDASGRPVDADTGTSVRFVNQIAKFIRVGDEVEVRGRWAADGTLRPEVIRNLKTGVKVTRGSGCLPLILYLVILVVALFILFNMLQNTATRPMR